MTRPTYVQINQLHEEEHNAGREPQKTPTGGTVGATARVGGRVVGEKVLFETEEIRVVPLNSRYEHYDTILILLTFCSIKFTKEEFLLSGHTWLNYSDVTVTDERGGVVCRDLAPPEDIDKAISDHERKAAGRSQPLLGEPSVIGRLRDMGVSFVTPSDLNCSQRRSEVSSKHYKITLSKLKV